MAIRRGLSALALVTLAACSPVASGESTGAPALPRQEHPQEDPQLQSQPERIAVDALIVDAQGYVAGRYRPEELPAALIADLTAEGFTCQHSATASQCGMSHHAFGSCFDVYDVQITAESVTAEKNRRCLGAEAP
ncbi:hypothetical protein [Terricaulis sp.]|uniref:hypothetical protein n=1 Tax=Terricaulis sp. TaxID=2768686 RepID=UPI0037847530